MRHKIVGVGRKGGEEERKGEKKEIQGKPIAKQLIGPYQKSLI